jgi:hypothetical protein
MLPEGQVELENTSRDAHSKVLILAVGSFLGDTDFKIKSKTNKTNKNKDDSVKI